MFEYRFDVGMSSVDAAGVLFFPELFRHAHDAYETFMAENAIPIAEVLGEGRYAVPIVHAEADYRRPLRHGSRVTVSLAVAKLGGSSFTLSYSFRDTSGETCATARTAHVIVDRASGESSAIPDSWRRQLEIHLEVPG